MSLGRGHDEVIWIGGVGFEVSFQLIVVVDNVVLGDKDFSLLSMWRLLTKNFGVANSKVRKSGCVVSIFSLFRLFTIVNVAVGDKEQSGSTFTRCLETRLFTVFDVTVGDEDSGSQVAQLYNPGCSVTMCSDKTFQCCQCGFRRQRFFQKVREHYDDVPADK